MCIYTQFSLYCLLIVLNWFMLHLSYNILCFVVFASFPIISYHIISYHIISYHNIPCGIEPCYTILSYIYYSVLYVVLYDIALYCMGFYCYVCSAKNMYILLRTTCTKQCVVAFNQNQCFILLIKSGPQETRAHSNPGALMLP